MPFEIFTKVGTGKGRKPHPIQLLEIGELYCSEGGTKEKWYQRIYQITKRTGNVYAYEKCVNGIVIKRIK